MREPNTPKLGERYNLECLWRGLFSLFALHTIRAQIHQEKRKILSFYGLAKKKKTLHVLCSMLRALLPASKAHSTKILIIIVSGRRLAVGRAATDKLLIGTTCSISVRQSSSGGATNNPPFPKIP